MKLTQDHNQSEQSEFLSGLDKALADQILSKVSVFKETADYHKHCLIDFSSSYDKDYQQFKDKYSTDSIYCRLNDSAKYTKKDIDDLREMLEFYLKHELPKDLQTNALEVDSESLSRLVLESKQERKIAGVMSATGLFMILVAFFAAFFMPTYAVLSAGIGAGVSLIGWLAKANIDMRRYEIAFKMSQKILDKVGVKDLSRQLHFPQL